MPDVSQVLAASGLTNEEISTVKADIREVDRLQKKAVTTSSTGTVTLDAVAAAGAKISERVIEEYAYGLRLAGGRVVGMKTDGLAAKVLGAPQLQALAKSSCRGSNKTGTAVWGPYIQLDSCNTARLTGALGAGAGVSGITAVLTSAVGVGVAAGVVAGILAIGAGAISWCSADGNGVMLRLLWTGTPYCTGP